ncbi:MAG: restriction endonuclease [Bacillota bacterium]
MNLDLTVLWDTIVAFIPIYLFLFGLVLLRHFLDRLAKKPKKSHTKKPSLQKNKTGDSQDHQRKSKKFDKIYGKITMAKVDAMTGEEFEILTERLIRVVYQDQIERTEFTTRTGDQGCDLIVHMKNGCRLGVQCKRHTGNVGNTPVQQILGAKPFYGLDSLMAVTSSYFTPDGLEAGKKSNVTMVDRDELKKWINIYNQKLEKLHGKMT